MIVPKALRFIIKRNSTLPYLELFVSGSDGKPFDFTGAESVTFSMSNSYGEIVIEDGEAEFAEDDRALGCVRYKWKPEDTAKAGDYSAEFDVVYSESEILTLPIEGDIRVKIYADISYSEEE